MKKRVHFLFTGIMVLLMLLCLSMTAALLIGIQKEHRIIQKIEDLGGIEYNEAFLEAAKKIPGIRSISPVLEIPVQLKLGEYTMDASLLGVSLKECEMKMKQSQEVILGQKPVLLLGEKALAALTDSNGHTISESQLKQLLASFDQQKLQYSLTEASGEKEMDEKKSLSLSWKDCQIAGIMSAPDDKIYLPYEQAEELALSSVSGTKVKKVLMTMQGSGDGYQLR
ncbi:MAG: hypothetical protein PHE06_14560 [Lachnospiraceae bacterium]|nr:hypothetical protein [Lachnospiraceae bacterium]